VSAASKDRVLVVDDEPQLLVALEDLLASDFIVLKTESSERALQIAMNDPEIAVVISDQRMPRLPGDRLLAKLTEFSRASRVLVTGYADLSAVVRAVNDGRIFAYVNKPWDPDEFRLTINKAAEHFRLQRELARERSLLEDLMNSVSDGIYLKDRELRFQRVNRAFVDLVPSLGSLHPDELVGRRLSELSTEPMALEAEQQEARVIEAGKGTYDIVQGTVREGALRWYSTSRAAVRGVNGVPEGVVGVVRDVTDRTLMAEALRASEERLRMVIEAAEAGLFDWDRVSGRVMYTEDFARLLGETLDDFEPLFSEFLARVHPDDAEAVSNALTTGTKLHTLECRLRHQDGGYRWFRLNGRATADSAGTPTRLVGSIQDITTRKDQEERIAILSRVRAVLGEVNGTIARVRERDALLQRSCEIAVRVGEIPLAMALSPLGDGQLVIASADALDRDFVPQLERSLTAGAMTLTLNEELADALRRGPVTLSDEEVLRAPAGEQLVQAGYASVALFPLLVSGEIECVYTLVTKRSDYFNKQEVTLLAELASNIAFALEHEAKSQRLSMLLSYDELTGLARRYLFVDRLQQRLAACDEEQPYLAVLLFDISRFRQINETLGRPGGDTLLRDVARRLEAVAGDSNRVARVDANAFGLFSTSFAGEGRSVEFLQQVRSAVLDVPFKIGDVELRIAGTVGIAVFPNDGDTAEVLLSRAETAGKAAKVSGQPYLFYTARMNQRVAEKLALENRLRKATEQQQFLLHYQPKIDLKTGGVVGLEALIRWRDPETGLVPPGAFIPVLEETGMILEVGTWVLNEAARQRAVWQAEGRDPPRIAVNVSAIQLAHPDFIPTVYRVLQAYPQASQGLDLEITESVIMTDFASNVEKLQLARESGLGVALDDFGTGYSSLGYLRRLPVDVLKLDRSFVAKMDEDAEDMAIVTTVISLAHSLNLKVVAEGVETASQARLLRLLKCDQIQGFLISRPLPAEQAVELLRSRYEFRAAQVAG
jgi:diguanylate cyclase (GGDEF)-like protein/PAS domain S-box-containing protein